MISILFVSCNSRKQAPSQTQEELIQDEQSLLVTQDKTSDSAETIDFGAIGLNESKSKNITITNKSNGTIYFDLSDLQSKVNNTQRFQIISTSCTILKSNKSCTIRILYKYISSENYASIISSQIITGVANQNYGKLILIGSKKEPTIEQNATQISQLGSISNINDKVRYYIQNPGTQAESILNSIPPEFIILQNNCDKVLKPKKTCWIDLKLDPTKLTNISSIQKTILINNTPKQIKLGNIPNSITQDLALCNETSIKINNECINISNYYNIQCNCYKNIPYTQSQTSFIMDGPLNTGIGYQTLDLYIPAIPNGKMVIYTHPMGENKELDVQYEVALKEEALIRGYSFISVEFRHPILEADELNSITNQWDIIHALKFARLNMKAFHLTDVDNIYSFSYSKGSLLLANITSNNDQLSDIFGRIGIKKMFILDGQVTYNLDSYYQNFIDKDSIRINIFITMSSFSYFANLNNLAKSAMGFKLTSDLAVLDSLRQVSAETNLIPSNKLPDIFFAYNQANKNRLLKSNEVLSTSGVFNINESDYLLHNPQSATAFCGVYSQFKTCNNIDNLQYNLDIQGIFNFFNN